jgi:hypothetical protein
VEKVKVFTYRDLNSNPPPGYPSRSQSLYRLRYPGSHLLQARLDQYPVVLVSFLLRPLLWSSDQSSWIQIQRSQIRFEVVGLEQDPLSLVRIIEELLERKVAAPV